MLDRLNDQQRRAATHADGPLRILAGAGTGKTTTLTSRVAWLVAIGTSADRIMLVTFTRRAAREMVGRTEALLHGAAPRAGGLVRTAGPSTRSHTARCAATPPRSGCPRASRCSTPPTLPT